MDDALPRGLVVANLTPLDGRGRVDLGMVHEHTAYLVEQGIRGFAPVGTTGEFLYLEEREKREITAAVVEAAGGRAGVIAGVWGISADEVANLAGGAEEAGAQAVFLTTPVYYRYSTEALLAWYQHAATEAELPVFCYQIPAYSGNEISLELFERMIAEGVVAGIKDSTGNAGRLRAELAVAGASGLVYGASDSFALEARGLGAHGFISALANVFPGAVLAAWNGDAASQAFVDGVRDAVKAHGGIAALKYLLTRRGFPFGSTRLPFSDLGDQPRLALDRAVDCLEPPGSRD